MKMKVRKQIRLNTIEDVKHFMEAIDGTNDEYILQDESGSMTADAHTMMGIMYAASAFNKKVYLINLSEDGYFPSGL
jgi:transcriptional regulator of NAD metabolism